MAYDLYRFVSLPLDHNLLIDSLSSWCLLTLLLLLHPDFLPWFCLFPFTLWALIQLNFLPWF